MTLTATADLPGIPPTVTTESTVAVLFMVVLGIGFLALIVRSLPGLIQAWKSGSGTPARAQESDEYRALLARITDAITRIDRGVEQFERFEGRNDQNMAAIRKSLHDTREWLIALEVRGSASGSTGSGAGERKAESGRGYGHRGG